MFKFLKRKSKTKHIWKEIKRENLGSYIDFGSHPLDISTMYRITIHEECLLTQDKRVREVHRLFPVK